jgi:hypothetical protein
MQRAVFGRLIHYQGIGMNADAFFVGRQGWRYPGNLFGRTPELIFTLPEGQRIAFTLFNPRPDPGIRSAFSSLGSSSSLISVKISATYRSFILLPPAALSKGRMSPGSRCAPCLLHTKKPSACAKGILKYRVAASYFMTPQAILPPPPPSFSGTSA